MKNLFIISGFVILTSACATKQKILDVSAASMTKASIAADEKLQDTGPVTGEFCSSSDDKGTVGLMDQALKNAQDQHKVDFLTNVTFWSTGKCMIVEGSGGKIISSSPSLKKQ